MEFGKVDHQFNEWASKAGAFVQTQYKGDSVRSTNLFDNNNKKWQLWLVPVNGLDEVVIHYWDYKKVRRHKKTQNSNLLSTLFEIESNIRNGSV